MSSFLCFALPFAILSAVFGWRTWKERQFVQRLHRDGQETIGTIVLRSTQSSGRGGTFCFVTIQYEVPVGGTPATQTQKQQVSIKAYERISEGERVSVRYFPDDPGNSRLSGEYQDRSKATSPLVLSGFFALMALLFLAAALRG